jgi:hypothetical protein
MSDSALAAVADPAGTTLPPTTRGGRPARGELLLDRAFWILAAFGPDHRALSLTELARPADRALHRAGGPELTGTTA